MMNKLKTLLNEHILHPKNPQKTYNLARQYDIEGQGAAAVSLYLRTAQLEEEDKELQFRSMFYAGRCYHRQGSRWNTALSLYQHACNIKPNSPMVHYFLAIMYVEKEDWHKVIMHCELGLHFLKFGEGFWETDYPGEDGLRYYCSYAKWRMSGTIEAIEELFDLAYKLETSQEWKQRTLELLDQIGYPWCIYYTGDCKDRFRYPFDGLETITKNYSKHMQDMFVLAVHKGKTNGKYLEIGSGNPKIHNNTFLLEDQFGWRGVSIDNDRYEAFSFSETRKNPILCLDATNVDYKQLLETHCFTQKIDYLQIDCDESSYDVLCRIPFDDYKFGVITIEHDAYRLGVEHRDKIRNHVLSKGYVLVSNDIAIGKTSSHEDWFVYPALVDEKMVSQNEINFVWDYMIK